MAAPGGRSLITGGLLPSPSPQEFEDQHFAMYASNLLPAQPSACLSPQLVKPEQGPIDPFCQPLRHAFLSDFHQIPDFHSLADVQQFQDISGRLVDNCGQATGGMSMEDRLSARKLHKADREKMRRDKLNEQFTELASALDPDRPKNDKATILGESMQVVKELRAEVQRLTTEHTSLLNESRDLTQEKNELREERTALKNETEKMQNQLQHMRTMSPWMSLDPSVMMGPATFPYHVSVPQSVSVTPSEAHQTATPRPVVSPTPYIPLTPPLGTFPLDPNVQAYAMFGSRHGDGNSPYLPYPSFPTPVNSCSSVERPYAQYASPVQPIPGYLVQMQPGQGSQSQISAAPTDAPIYRPCVAGVPIVSTKIHNSTQRSKGGRHRSQAAQGNFHLVPTDLPLQTPTLTSTSLESQLQASELVAKTESLASAVRVEGDPTLCHPKPSLTYPSATKSRKENLNSSLAQYALLLDAEENQLLEYQGFGDEQIHDPTLRPPAA